MTFDRSSRSRTTTNVNRPADHTVVTGAVVGWHRAWRGTTTALGQAGRWSARVVMPSGWFALVSMTIGITVGLLWGWAESLAMGSIAALLVTFAVVFVLGRRRYQVDLGMLHQRVVAGTSTHGTISVTNAGNRTALPARVEVPMGDALAVVNVPLLRAGAVFEETVLLPTERRTVMEVGPVRAVRSDPLGLFRIVKQWDQRHTMYVHPATVSIPSTNTGFIRDLEGQPTRVIADSDISFHALREYAPGDALKHIHWKATAKTGVPMVRQFEQTRKSHMAVVLSLRAGDYAEAEEFEIAVGVAGSLGGRALRDSRDVDVVVPDPIPEVAQRRSTSVTRLPAVTARTLLDALSGLQAAERMVSFNEVCELTAQSMPGISVVFMIVGSTPTLRELRSAALKFPEDIGIVAVVVNPQQEPRVRVTKDLTVISVPLLDDLRHLLARGAA